MTEAEAFFSKAIAVAFLSGDLDLLERTIKIYNMFKFSGNLWMLEV